MKECGNLNLLHHNPGDKLMEIIKIKDEENPLCPHCGKELREIKEKRFSSGFFQIVRKYIYYCPLCKKVLGISIVR
jgi:hypothetical protein